MPRKGPVGEPVQENIDLTQVEEVRPTGEAGKVLTFNEIDQLTAESGKPAETLMNVVALIARTFHTDVCSAYLLEPDRANLVLAATLGLRPSCVGNLRMALNEGLAGLVAEQVRPVAVEQVKNHPRFKYFSEAGEEPYQSFLGVPLIDRGVLQGVLVVQTIETRVFREDEIRALVQAAAQVAPVVSEARTLDRFIAPAQERLWALARNLWWSWDHDTSSLFHELDPALWWQVNQNPISLLSEIPFAGIERRAEKWSCTAASTTPTGDSVNIWKRTVHGAARHAGVLRTASSRLFFGRVRIARIDSHLFRGIGRARRRPHQERLRSGHPADRHWSFLRPGLFPAATGPRCLATGRVSALGHKPIAHGTGHRAQGRSRYGANRDAHRFDSRESLAN